jgi:iron complex transport system substrate-binding protein
VRRRTLLGALAALPFAAAPLVAAARTRFTDDGGRTVGLPARIARVMPAGPPATTDLIIMAPQKLVGLTRALTPAQAAYLPQPYRALPGLGRLTGRGNTLNLEVVLKVKPDLIVDLGYVSEGLISLADRVQRETGIPYVLIGGELGDTPATLRKLGAAVGTEARAERLARYAEETLALLKSRLADIPPAERPSVYFARGPKGLETGVSGSINAEAIAFAGARNVATPALGARGLAEVSMENLFAWQPQFLIAIDPAFYRALWRDPLWRRLKAVEEKHVYLAPAYPFGWVDEPPAANRLIGLRWLAKLLYPSRFPQSIRDEARRFYALFYQQEPSEAQLDKLLAGAEPPS